MALLTGHYDYGRKMNADYEQYDSHKTIDTNDHALHLHNSQFTDRLNQFETLPA